MWLIIRILIESLIYMKILTFEQELSHKELEQNNPFTTSPLI